MQWTITIVMIKSRVIAHNHLPAIPWADLQTKRVIFFITTREPTDARAMQITSHVNDSYGRTRIAAARNRRASRTYEMNMITRLVICRPGVWRQRR
jgi:hypothetical protein